MDVTPATVCEHCGLPAPARRRSAGGAFCCVGCRIAHDLARLGEDQGQASHRASALQLRLWMGVFLTMNMMAFSWWVYTQDLYATGQAHNKLASLFAYLLMFLCTAVLACVGSPLLLDLLDRRPRRTALDADLLILIGVAGAYLLSVINTIRAQGGLYYEVAAIILVFVTLGRYLESAAKRRATLEARTLLAAAPRVASVRRDQGVIEVPVEQVRLDDMVRVRPGEVLAVDGEIAEGSSHVSEASLTGESQPRSVAAGDRVLAGSLCVDGQLWVSPRRVGEDRVIAQTVRLLEEARTQLPPIQRLADRVAGVFVPIVIALSLTVFFWHSFRGEPSRGLFDALAVLLVSCPCALGLAAPLASWVALKRAAGMGVLVDSAATLERASRIRRVFFDKTGTLTDPRLRLESIEPLTISQDQALRWAGALESSSLHPIARAITEECAKRQIALPPALDARILPGVGVEASVEGRRLSLGGSRLLPEASSDAQQSLRVHLVENQRRLATFTLSESPRQDAAATLRELRHLRISTAVLTGDGPGPASRLASLLSIPVEHSLLPADKLDRLTRARKQTPGVAMVGDGVNDGPVLAAADLGFALGSATDLAKQAGNVRLLADRLDRVPMTIRLARHAMNRIRLNLFWAFAYNLVGVGLAAMGLLNPVFAALAMFLSSLMVVRTSSGAGKIAGVP